MRKLYFFVFLLICTLSVFAQNTGGGGEANPDLKTNHQALKTWQNMKFGLFIHWGPVSLRGTEIGWSRGREVPIEEYDNLYKEFNPALFDAGQWVQIAKDAGMKYIVITSKHHDGFSIWDSEVSDHDIMATPFRRDILQELSAACKQQGILFGTYHSICDWHHPDYTTRYGGDPRPLQESDMDVYIQYLKNQVRELIMKYETDILWFDGEWEDSWDHQKGMDLYQYARGLKNDILINNRVDKGREGMHGMTRSTVFAGDFGTPEQRVGAFYPADPWESCITLCRQWSWKPNDQLKSLRECIHTLVQTAGGGGNLLLNIGPMSDGRIEQRQIDRLLGIGRWLKENGESIYGTRGGPYKPNRWLASTCKDRRIFIHLLGWPLGQLSLASPPDRTVRSVKFLNGGELSYTQTNSLIDIRLPENPVDQHVTVIVLELDKNTESIEPLEVMPIALKGLHGAQLKLKDPYSQKYAADGIESLLDENRGSRAYTDGNWLGFEQVDFEVDIDFGVEKPVKAAGLGFLQSQDSWIFLPETVEIFVSADGETYKPAGRLEMQPVKSNRAIETEDVLVKIKPLKTRYLRIRAENTGLCPDWHKGAGGKAWLFVDEIIVD